MQLDLHKLDTRYEKLRRRAPRREERLLTSLASAGQQTPVVVIVIDGGRHVLLDGYKRVRALTKLREDAVTATPWSLPEKEPLILERLMRTSEEIDALEQGWLLEELHSRFEMSEAELAQRVDKSKSWVSRRLGLVTVLPEKVQERVLDGLLGAHAAMKFLLPLARANEGECLALVKALGSRKPSTREMENLDRGLTEGSAKARELVLTDPWLVPAGRSGERTDGGPEEDACRGAAGRGRGHRLHRPTDAHLPRPPCRWTRRRRKPCGAGRRASGAGRGEPSVPEGRRGTRLPAGSKQ
jgi:ParB/RepB/Spo0J family partition protein